VRRTLASVAVIIPARDEEKLLPRCLAAVHRSVDELALRHPAITVRTLVVADRTTDGTLDVIAADPRAEAVVVEHGNVGAARRAGAAHLLSESTWRRPHAWMAITDADSVVPPEWLVEHVEHADRGADVIVGTVTPDFGGLSAEQIDAWTASHPDGVANGHVHGANLGIRATAYTAVGGFRPHPVGEDVDLVARIASTGFAVVASGRLDVMTSSRRVGRAPDGYASWLHGGGLLRQPAASEH
jgi:glycosyltransferase involved in cell wall biosynthesis